MTDRLLNELKKDGSYEDKSDDLLVSMAVHGDRYAWKEIVRRHYRSVSATVLRLTGGRDLEDVVQEVFIQLFKSLPSFRGDSSFSTFLYRLAVNSSVREVRKMTTLSSMIAVGTESIEKMLDSTPEPDAPYLQLEKEDEERLIRKAMLELPPELRLLLTLFEVEGMTLREISEITKTPVTTIASRINKAKIMLLKSVRGKG
jgi:RNA polymerase sigma-70 factor, ECF subfamily